MLRAHIEKHKIGVIARAAHPPVLGAETQRLLLSPFLLRRQLIGPHLRRASGMVLAQRMAHPTLRHQDALEMRVSVEDDPEHVPRLADRKSTRLNSSHQKISYAV